MSGRDKGVGQEGQKGWSGVSPDAIVFSKKPERAMLLELDPRAAPAG